MNARRVRKIAEHGDLLRSDDAEGEESEEHQPHADRRRNSHPKDLAVATNSESHVAPRDISW